jgi:molybdate transport system substrate-binding protein
MRMPAPRQTIIGSLCLAALALFAALANTPARAEYLVAPDVVVFCEPTLQPALAKLAATWRQQTGIPVRFFPSPTPLMLEQLARHPRSDLIIGEGSAAADAAIGRNLIKPETRFALWRGRLVVATAEAKAPTLAASAGMVPIALVDPDVASAGAETRNAMVALGLWEAVQRRMVGVADTTDAAFLLAQGQAKLALVYATDVAANPTFSIADTLPDDSYGPVLYWVAETQNALSPNTKKFETFLRQAPMETANDGLEVSP